MFLDSGSGTVAALETNSLKLGTEQQQTSQTVFDETEPSLLTSSISFELPSIESLNSVAHRSESSETIAPPQDSSIYPKERLQNLNKVHRIVSQDFLGKERIALIEERQPLVLKQFAAGLSLQEERHLKMIDWKIDRIDEELSRPRLGKIERIVEMQEKLGKRVEHLFPAQKIKAVRKPSIPFEQAQQARAKHH